MTSNNDNPDHLLAALRYFNNEMSPVEIVSYEALLADDFAAQNALAEVVLIQQSLKSMTCSDATGFDFTVRVTNDAESVSSHTLRERSRRSGSKTSGGIALAFSVAAIAIIGYVIIHSSITSQAHLPSMAGAIKSSPIEHQRQDVSVATMWALMSDSESPVLGSVTNDHHDSSWESDDISSSYSSEELDVPDWMFAAVEASRLNDDLPEMNEFDDEETL